MMSTLRRRIAIIGGFLFVGVVIGLLSYTLVPEKKSEIVEWAVDHKEYDRAYVTLATTDYSVIGVLTLAYTLREVHSLYPLVVLVSDDVTEPFLKV